MKCYLAISSRFATVCSHYKIEGGCKYIMYLPQSLFTKDLSFSLFIPHLHYSMWHQSCPSVCCTSHPLSN